ncbi:hypothetical protein [Acaryochloris marina]|uniref:Homeodomain phBC6A51-type domain-containing protein n=1 Tax=Acaryochloris marina (strain MBIC 11017) TaxID=329726 RepID=B0CCS3_ACAM1|nr:hypothetical protein [Acaryochloris marina]ABW29235.1 hypothetical protein AM1_4256 [Acaryochloris marina MBIC11017]
MSDIDCLEGLSEQQKIFLGARLTGSTVGEAAEVAKIHRSTYYDWLANSELFNRALETAKARQWRDLLDSLVMQNELAVKTIRDITTGELKSRDTPVRLRAAECLLSNVLKFSRQSEIDQRLKQIEAALGLDDPANDFTKQDGTDD